MNKTEFLFYKSIEDNDFKQFCETIDNVNISGTDNYEKIPLLRCAELGRTNMIKELIKRNADINKYDYMRANSLMWASESGNMETLTTLLDAGIDVNHIDREYATTPIMWWACAKNTTKEHIFELFKRGADLAATDINKESVLDYARSSSNPEIYPYIVHLLRKQNFYTNKLDKVVEEYNNYIIAMNNNSFDKSERKIRQEEFYKKIKYYLVKGARIDEKNKKKISFIATKFGDKDIKKRCEDYNKHVKLKESALTSFNRKEKIRLKASHMTPYEIMHSNDLEKDI